MQSKSIKTFTSQADELYRQAQEVKIPDYIPLYIICYETLREQKELSCPKSKRNGKCCKRYSKKISRNRRIQTANALILRKAIISVKKRKDMLLIDQLVQVVAVLMGNLSYILFRHKANWKNYVVLLLWATCQYERGFGTK